MFYYIEGTVTVLEQNLAVLDVGGVGYRINVSLNTAAGLELGGRARLYTYCNIKEDAFDIYGFYEPAEKRCYELLVSVSGVGPKAAISILSSCTPAELAMAIINSDERPLVAVSGVGKRTAQRIILELKDKISKENIPVERGRDAFVKTSVSQEKKSADVAAALAVLGFTSGEISAALKDVDTDGLSVEDIVRLVLKNSVK